MKTTNVILLGVVGVGAVGGYMFLKNKKAKDALLSGSLPTTNQGSGFASAPIKSGAPTPSGTTPTDTTPIDTTPLIPTPQIITKVDVVNDSNLDAYNLQQTLEQLKNLNNRLVNDVQPQFIYGQLNPKYDGWIYFQNYQYGKDRAVLIEKLAKLGYKFDKGLLVKI